ncbi:MAG: zinc ABC transporter substrate-binding protein [Proteobacteria bacterium]|nr:zinc ABC transporter substrate-binding protein [Pseudomonadota bacterium]MBU4470063.1 zinc ABC transporter substrate-binding protein [Pseudomonadota bacterium]MCG2750708.1 zinc ABC transporter substrate-binding protein [Desulfobacteraceae bacterium]
MKIIIFSSLLLCGFAMLPLCGTASNGMNVAVSILPQKYFTEKIAGDGAGVLVMVPKGANPETYEPKPRQMTELAGAQVYLAMDMPFESVWVKKFQAVNPRMKVFDITSGIEKISMAPDQGHRHYKHSGTIIKDPHVWTSPLRVKILAKNIHSALCSVYPELEPVFSKNLQVFLKEIDALHLDLEKIFADQPEEKKTFMAFHPAWGYFAKDYGLKQVAIECEGKNPSPAKLKEIIDEAKSLGIRVIFVQPQFSSKSAEVIARAIDGVIVPADPLAYEWEQNLRHQAETFKAALK